MRTFLLRRLGLIGAQQTIFQGSAVKTSDDGLHFFRVGGVDEGEPFRFLRFRVADYLDIVVDKVF